MILRGCIKTTLSKILCKWKQDSAVSLFLYLDSVFKNNYKLILLTHNPDLILKLPRLCALTLLLAGHTHGGQVRLPLNIEFTLLKKDILPKKGIYYGFHTYNGTPLYITSGIGCSLLPIRFRSKAEIALIE